MWNILYFKTISGKSPIEDWILALPMNVRARTYRSIELLKEFGTNLGAPHCKKLSGTNLYELRILGQNNLRIIYVAIVGKNFLLLHGFLKKSEKTPLDDIKTARKRYLTYIAKK